MKKEEIIHEIEYCFNSVDLAGFEENLDLLIKEVSDEEASKILSEILYKTYITYKAQGLAKMMEIIIRKRPNLALLKFPENFLFRIAIIIGSIDLYECYIEEALQPILSKVDADEHKIYYMKLFETAKKLILVLSDNIERCVKGMDYNGAFSTYEKNSNVVLINREDYEVMEDVVEKYNSLVGRKAILKDLILNAGIELKYGV